MSKPDSNYSPPLCHRRGSHLKLFANGIRQASMCHAETLGIKRTEITISAIIHRTKENCLALALISNPRYYLLVNRQRDLMLKEDYPSMNKSSFQITGQDNCFGKPQYIENWKPYADRIAILNSGRLLFVVLLQN